MRLLLLVIAWLPALVQAQQVTWVDLSGPWRYSEGDDPRRADPGFDDSNWESREGRQTRGTWWWLRRRVVLTEPPTGGLSLTIGVLAPGYEVYLNGTPIGRAGGFSLDELEIMRPRTFDIPPALAQREMVIAIRCHHYRRFGPSGAWGDTSGGPWLLTSDSAAPRQEGWHSIAVQRLSNSVDAAQGPVLLLFTAMVWGLWLRARHQMDLFWLAGYLFVQALQRFQTWLVIDENSHPFGFAIRWGPVLWSLLPTTLLALFANDTFGVRKLARPIWAATLVAALLWVATPPERGFFFVAIWTIQAMTGLALMLAAAKRTDKGSWKGMSQWLVMASILAILFIHGSRWTLWAWRPIGNLYRLGIYGVSITPLSVSLAATGIAAALVWRLLEDRQERLRLSNELAAARIVQQLLLSAGTPSPEYSVSAKYEPAQEVGGDFYQVLPLPEGGLLVAVGDVSGKGLKAAMVVSMVVGVLRSQRSLPPVRLLEELNRTLAYGMDGGFVTCLVARLEPHGETVLANAGHLAPYADGREQTVENGLPLGLLADAVYGESRLTWERSLTLLTDGVVEAASASGELFGFDRTLAISGEDAATIAAAAKAWGQNDDITVVTVRRRA